MKFSHSLQFNAVPEWSSKYIAYTTLKKLIYSLQRDSLRHNEEDLELSYLIDNENSFKDATVVFRTALDLELQKINDFFELQQGIIFRNFDDLMVDVDNFEVELRRGSFSLPKANPPENTDIILPDDDQPQSHKAMNNFDTDPETEFTPDEENQEETPLSKSKSIDEYLKSPKQNVWYLENLPPQLVLLSENRIVLRKRIIGMFTSLSELQSYVELNYTGFKKALKKFDKSLETNLKEEYLNYLSENHVFKSSTTELVAGKVNDCIKLYQLICNHSDFETAKSELSVHLREHVVWERNTVWRDMIGLERKNYAATEKKSIQKPDLSFELNLSLKNPLFIKILLITIITFILLQVNVFKDPVQERCFAILICGSLLWATETIPLFVTSLLIPLLIVVLKVLKHDDGSTMNASESSKYILATMWNSVILLLLGGFTLAAALSKYNIAKLISTMILSKAGTNPSVVLITIMSIALFASMWVSNVAAPVLCFSLIQPLLRTLPKDSTFKKALILGIALASNIGGMASPIASPQNIIAIESMDPQPSWGQWFVISIPTCLLCLGLVWVFLLITFNYKNTKLVAIRTSNEKFTFVQWYIIGISIITIVLWCVASKLQGIFGEMGIISLIPIILFFGGGLLTTDDFNNYPWNIVMLAMGGTALGKAVSSSGLLSTIAISIQRQVEGFSLYGVAITFGLLILIMATFVSHTVAALITVPLLAEIGANMPEPHPRLLILITAFLCSAAMGLPTSGFPNVTAICMTDEFGQPYLNVGTFITRGVPSSIICYFVVITVGFAIMKLINF